MKDLQVQWNVSRKDTLNKGHLSSEDTFFDSNHIELATTCWATMACAHSATHHTPVLYVLYILLEL